MWGSGVEQVLGFVGGVTKKILRPSNGAEAEWKVFGKHLSQLSNALLRERQEFLEGVRRNPVVPSARDDFASVGESLEGAKSSCVSSRGVKLFGDGRRAFCTYYTGYSDNGHTRYNLHLKVFSDDSVDVITVNENPILEEHVHHVPTVLSSDNGTEYKIVFALLETGGVSFPHASFVQVREYSINHSNPVKILKTGSVKLTSYPDQAGAYANPLNVVRDDAGNIVVVARAKDSRAGHSNQAYVMWRLSKEDLSVINPRGSKGNAAAKDSYLFRRTGANADGSPERLVVWNVKEGKMALTYILRSLNRDYKGYHLPYTARSSTILIDAPSGIHKCLVARSRCDIGGSSAVLANDGVIDSMMHLQVGDTYYLFYTLSKKSVGASEALPVRYLNIMSYGAEGYKVFTDVFTFHFRISAFNVKEISADGRVGIMLLSEDAKMHIYELAMDSLLGEGFLEIREKVLDYRVLSVGEFVHIVSNGTPFVLQNEQVVSQEVSTANMISGDGDKVIKEVAVEINRYRYHDQYLELNSDETQVGTTDVSVGYTDDVRGSTTESAVHPTHKRRVDMGQVAVRMHHTTPHHTTAGDDVTEGYTDDVQGLTTESVVHPTHKRRVDMGQVAVRMHHTTPHHTTAGDDVTEGYTDDVQGLTTESVVHPTHKRRVDLGQAVVRMHHTTKATEGYTGDVQGLTTESVVHPTHKGRVDIDQAVVGVHHTTEGDDVTEGYTDGVQEPTTESVVHPTHKRRVDLGQAVVRMHRTTKATEGHTDDIRWSTTKRAVHPTRKGKVDIGQAVLGNSTLARNETYSTGNLTVGGTADSRENATELPFVSATPSFHARMGKATALGVGISFTVIAGLATFLLILRFLKTKFLEQRARRREMREIFNVSGFDYPHAYGQSSDYLPLRTLITNTERELMLDFLRPSYGGGGFPGGR